MYIKGERGQSTVEFVFVLPWFLLALVMVVGLAAKIAMHQMQVHRAYMEYRANIVSDL